MSRTGGAVVLLATLLGACSSKGSAPIYTFYPPTDPTLITVPAEAAPPFQCAGPTDCAPSESLALTQQPVCCLESLCVYGTSEFSDAGAPLLEASSYDQSCQVNWDCRAVSESNAHGLSGYACVNAAINANVYDQYEMDLAKAVGSSCVVYFDCATGLAPCCRGGSCSVDCESQVSTMDAATEASTDGGFDASQAATPCSAAICEAPPGDGGTESGLEAGTGSDAANGG